MKSMVLKAQLLTITFLICLIINVSQIEGQKKRRLKECHIKEFFRCSDSSMWLTARINGTGIVATESEHKLFCDIAMNSGPECVKGWLRKCATPFQVEIITEFVLKAYKDSLHDFCVNKKKDFLKHSPCLHSKVKLAKSYRHTCVQGIQAGFEHVHNFTELDRRIKGICCVYNRWESCISDHMIYHCGRGSESSIVSLISHATLFAVPQICPRHVFDPSSNFCVELMPPYGTPAMGAKGNDYFSYVFSRWCPNVGYGIVPEDERHKWPLPH